MSLWGPEVGWRFAAIFAAGAALPIAVVAVLVIALGLRGPARTAGAAAVAVWTFVAIAINGVSLLLASADHMTIAEWVNTNGSLYAVGTYAAAIPPAALAGLAGAARARGATTRGREP